MCQCYSSAARSGSLPHCWLSGFDTNSCSPVGERAVSPQQPLQPPVPKTETNGTCETDSAAEKDEDSLMESQYTVCRCPTATLVLPFTLITVFLYWPHVTSNLSQFISVDLGLQLTILSSLIELSVNPRTAGFFLALNGPSLPVTTCVNRISVHVQFLALFYTFNCFS